MKFAPVSGCAVCRRHHAKASVQAAPVQMSSCKAALIQGDIGARGGMQGAAYRGSKLRRHAVGTNALGSMQGAACRRWHAVASAMRARQRSGCSDEQLSGYGANLVFFHLFA